MSKLSDWDPDAPHPTRDDYYAEKGRLWALGWETCARDEDTLRTFGFRPYGDEKWRLNWGTAMGNWWPAPLVYVVTNRMMNHLRRLRLEALAADPDLVSALHAVWMGVGSIPARPRLHNDPDPRHNERVRAVENYLTDLGLGPPKRTIL